MKHAINMQGIKALSLAAMLIITSQTVYPVTVVGQDVPALQEVFKKLRSGASEENTGPNIVWKQAWKTARFRPYIHMPNKDLRGATTKGNTFRLQFANFAGSNLTGANLENAFLADANLTNADLTNANLTGADFRRTDFSGAKGLTAEQKAYARSQRAINVPD